MTTKPLETMVGDGYYDDDQFEVGPGRVEDEQGI